jgi:hypothetical protein
VLVLKGRLLLFWEHDEEEEEEEEEAGGSSVSMGVGQTLPIGVEPIPALLITSHSLLGAGDDPYRRALVAGLTVSMYCVAGELKFRVSGVIVPAFVGVPKPPTPPVVGLGVGVEG